MAHACMNRYGILSCTSCVGMPDITVYEVSDEGHGKIGYLFIEDGQGTFQADASGEPVTYTKAQTVQYIREQRRTGRTFRKVQ